MSTFTELAPSSTVVDMNTGGSGENNSSSNSSSLSGVATALSRAAAVLPSSEILQSRLSDIWSRSRSWTEFANTSQMSRPEPSELFERVQENLTYYAFNYLVILLILSALTILTSPLAFLGGMFIVAAYFYLFFLNPDAIKLGGIALDNKVKAAFIMIFSLVVLWVTGAGAAFTGLLLVVSVIALTHAAFRKPPGEADFETAYTPATV